MNKYETLVKILDEICLESCSNLKLYRPELGKVTLVQARSRALIHFFLKSHFGLLDFDNRESLITDGSNDGGIDAFFIDELTKRIYLIQSKFRDNIKNYEKTEIKNEELWTIDLKRIITGKKKDNLGNNYNGQIYKFQNNLSKIHTDKYTFILILVANLNESQGKYVVRSFLPRGFEVNVYNYEKVYKELLFPYIRGNFFNEKELNIIINLSNRNSDEDNPIKYKVKTKYGNCCTQMFFVPTEEIAKIMYKYKNSILEYNPRSYLGMQTMGVNKNIEDSITKSSTNDFLLLNNGITILSTKVSFTENTGKKNMGKITVINPQIINGGQTSFALSHIYERFLSGDIKSNPFKGKEVLLKVIESKNARQYGDFTGLISLATNNQSVIKQSDLKSNDKSQVELQQYIFEFFGLYYERKKGEFFNSIRSSYIKKEQVVDRVDFLRTAYSSYFPDLNKITKNPKNITEKDLFSDPLFKIIANHADYKKFALSYLVYKELQGIKKRSKKDTKNKWFFKYCGNALRYGDIAVTIVVMNSLYKIDWRKKDISGKINEVLDKWKKFEKFAFKLKSNQKYFNKKIDEKNPIGYYKGDTLIKDLISFFI